MFGFLRSVPQVRMGSEASTVHRHRRVVRTFVALSLRGRVPRLRVVSPRSPCDSAEQTLSGLGGDTW